MKLLEPKWLPNAAL